MKLALEELGFGTCFHMQDVVVNPKRMRAWHAVVKGGQPDWPALFGNFQSTVDWPACNYVPELMAAYPEAKMVLNVRDPERWYDSVATTIYTLRTVLPSWVMRIFPPLALYRNFVNDLVWEGTFAGRFEDKAYAIDVFNKHNERIQGIVPAGRLLVFSVKEGWEPLCEFLDVPVPDKPFPHANDRQSMMRRVQLLRAVIIGGMVAGAGLVAWLIYLLLR